MRTVRIAFRLFRMFSMGYTVWRGSRATKMVWVLSLAWRILLRRRGLPKPPRVSVTFLDPHTSTIYRRQGWRRIGSRSEL